MKAREKIWLSGLLAVATLFAGNAFATYCLPDSIHQRNIWPDGSIYEQNSLDMLLDFAVCQTDNLHFARGEDAPANHMNIASQYTHIYRLFNHPDDTCEEILCFAILDIDAEQIGNALIRGAPSYGGNRSWTAGLTAEDRSTQKVWRWTLDEGGISQGKHWGPWTLR